MKHDLQLFVSGMLSTTIILMIVVWPVGCTPYWVKDMPGYSAPVEYLRVANLDKYCLGLSEKACAIRYPDKCLVVLGSKATQCTIDHEVKTHCKGWNHDLRTVYREDCGDELPKEVNQ